ncbi:MAG TPA: antibiotic biosynthesis monooxygenase [Burkholderiaceae bacterium]|nr:antibiotic biosynthesis monooxygenase [Burkholderiaceae bacterium]
MVLVTFQSRLRADADLAALEALGARMYGIAAAMPGFVSYKDFSAADGENLTLVEFESEETLAAWRDQPEHREAQERGRREFFSDYRITIATRTRAYVFDAVRGRRDLA